MARRVPDVWLDVAWIRQGFDETGKKKKDLAEVLGVSPQVVTEILKGGRPLRLREVPKVEQFLGRKAPWTANGREVRLAGRIGAGGMINKDVDQSARAHEMIRVPFAVEPGISAFEVEGDSMLPAYGPGEVILCGPEISDLQAAIGKEVALQTTEGDVYLKRLERGSAEGLYTLQSYNASPIRDVSVEWVAPIIGTLKAGQWARISPDDRQRMVSRAKNGLRRKK
jgi:phage repressor protein C with HTH and peptisase S24 domain